eukprot:6184119-Pleurochrysis_carterae.AAC.3
MATQSTTTRAATVKELAQARVDAPTGRLKEGGAQRAAAIVSEGIQEPRERSASAAQVPMRRESNLGNCACDRVPICK